MKSLKQRNLFSKREFRIADSKLFYKISEFGNEKESTIPFENLEVEPVSYKNYNYPLLAISLVFYIMAYSLFSNWLEGKAATVLGGPILAIVASGFLGYFWFGRENYWQVRCFENQNISILKDKPSKKKVNDFISELRLSRNIYLKETYANIDENLSYENQLSSLKWLRSLNALSKEEFDLKYDILKTSIKPDKRNIGFSSSN